MERILFFLCVLLLAATPAGAGNGLAPPASGRPEARAVPKPDEGKPGRLVRPQPDRPDNASGGASSAPERRGGTDLGYEAEKEEEAWLKKERKAAPFTGRSRAP